MTCLALVVAACGPAIRHRSAPQTAVPEQPPVAAPRAGAPWWQPGSTPIAWQWVLANLASASDMGTGVRTASGAAAPNPTVYDIDGFSNSAATVAALHARGNRVICYLEVGAAEDYRPDYDQFPAAALGNGLSGYPSERYLNITNPQVAATIKARIAMCAGKGFDAIEPDIDDSHANQTGFPITEAENIAYNRNLAAYAHSLGLGWGQKNGDNDVQFSQALEPTTDFALDESCYEFDTCTAAFGPYLNAHKAVFEVEYKLPTSGFCPRANSQNLNSEKQTVGLSGGREPCR